MNKYHVRITSEKFTEKNEVKAIKVKGKFYKYLKVMQCKFGMS